MNFLSSLRSVYGLLLIVGLSLVALGSLSVFVDQLSLSDLLRFLAYFILGLGLILLLYSRRQARAQQAYFGWIVLALLHLTLGVILLRYPAQALKIYTYTIGIWALAIGGALAIAALRQKNHRILSAINAAISLSFGLIILFVPLAESSRGKLVGINSLILGAFLVYLGIKLKQIPAASASASGESTSDSEAAS